MTGVLVTVDVRNCFQNKNKKGISQYNFGQSKFLLIQLEIHEIIFFYSLKAKERNEISNLPHPK